MPFRLGPTELIIILVIVLVIFGAGKLGNIGSALGKSIRGFRDAAGGKDEETEAKQSKGTNSAKAEGKKEA